MKTRLLEKQTLRRLLLIVVTAAIVIITACASKQPVVNYNALNSAKFPPTNTADVSVWITTKPQFEYEEMGILESQVWESAPDEARIIQLFKEQAARLGADGIIMLDSRGGSQANTYTKVTYAYTVRTGPT